jgi:hypothetical protein
MTKIGTVFTFTAPNGWNSSREGNRHIFHGPSREELIVSASLLQGIGTSDDLVAMQQRLFQNAEKSMKSAAAHPALTVTQPFQQDACVSTLECWTLRAQTHEGDTLFYQVVFRDPRGVLLATLEAPNTTSAANGFEQFIKSVGVISESETPMQ